MSTHPRRNSWRSALPIPTPADIKRARGCMTQAAASAVIGYSGPEKWARIEAGTGRPHPAAWELFLLRTGQHPASILSDR